MHLYLDGQQKTAFWKNSGGMLDDKPAREGGVDPSLTPRTARSSSGSLVLGQVRVGGGHGVHCVLLTGVGGDQETAAALARSNTGSLARSEWVPACCCACCETRGGVDP